MKTISLILLIFALLICVLFALNFGKFELSLIEILKFNSLSDAQKIILFDIRLPRIIAAIIIGAGLSVAGGVYQNMFINPLVSPSILGVLAGGSFGAALAMVLNLSLGFQMLLSFIFGFVAVGMASAICFMTNAKNLTILVLVGIISGAFFSSLLSILKYSADPNETLPAITYFLMGSLSMTQKDSLYWLSLPMIFSIIMLIALAKSLDALSMGKEEAKTLGINTTKIKFLVIVLATFVSATSVMLAGIRLGGACGASYGSFCFWGEF